MLYGAWGFPITVMAATIAVSVAFLIARHVASDGIRSLLERRRLLAAIDDAVAEQGCQPRMLLPGRAKVVTSFSPGGPLR
jgi:uncharacterized membrane protein YdjX (TVP38/TMEM64 family)